MYWRVSKRANFWFRVWWDSPTHDLFYYHIVLNRGMWLSTYMCIFRLNWARRSTLANSECKLKFEMLSHSIKNSYNAQCNIVFFVDISNYSVNYILHMFAFSYCRCHMAGVAHRAHILVQVLTNRRFLIVISTAPKPIIHRNLCENTGPEASTAKCLYIAPASQTTCSSPWHRRNIVW